MLFVFQSFHLGVRLVTLRFWVGGCRGSWTQPLLTDSLPIHGCS